MSTRLRLTVPNGVASIEPARLAVHGFLAGRVSSERAIYRLDLVLEESLMNRAWHAYPQGEGRDTLVQVDLGSDALMLRFEDDGVAFDPTLAPDPTTPQDLAHAPAGGRGLMLTRKAARQWFYERRGLLNILTVVLALD